MPAASSAVAGGSMRMTSAPQSARCRTHVGPARANVRSRTRIPDSGSPPLVAVAGSCCMRLRYPERHQACPFAGTLTHLAHGHPLAHVLVAQLPLDTAVGQAALADADPQRD